MADFPTALPLFRGLRESDLQVLAADARLVTLSAGEVLIRQGDAGDALFIVRSGALQVMVTAVDGTEQSLATLGPDDVVGEMALLYGRPRAATVRATSAGAVWEVPAVALERLFAANPSARTRLLDAAARRLPSLYLASVPLFAGLDAEALRELDLETNWVRLDGGDTLFRRGDRSGELYVVVWGRLEVVLDDDEGQPVVVRHLGHGDVVGEVALFTDAPRNATVRAVRDTELVRLSRAEMHRLIEQHPRGAIEMIRLLAGRVEPRAAGPVDAPVSTIAILAAGEAPLAAEWTARLIGALQGVGGPTLHVDHQAVREAFGPGSSSAEGGPVPAHVTTWLHEQEDHFRFVVFDCEALPDRWVEFGLRQADLVLFVAPPGSAPVARDRDRRIFSTGGVAPSTTKVLVCLHDSGTARPRGTARWLDLLPVSRHHHVRVDRPGDFARVARFVAGTAHGLALSGGGARTWAHVGVLRALEERAIPIDTVGGVSAGVFTAAYYALGNDAATVERLSLENMGNYSLIGDATLPMAAFMSGKNLVRAYLQMFGDIEIEDLWLPFFCLSASLSKARVVVHDRGPLWKAIRATTSVPGIEPPLCVNGELLVDGGVLNNMPVDVMRSRCPGTVIASDVSLTVDLVSEAADVPAASGWPLLWARINPFGTAKPVLPHIFEILARTATLSSVHHGATVARAADVYIRTPTESVPTFDWKAGAVLAGRAHALALQILDTWHPPGAPRT